MAAALTPSPYELAAQQVQIALAESLPAKVAAIETHYASDPRLAELKEKFKVYISESVITSDSCKNLVLMLIDLQNDFTMKDAALYADKGENVILSNMALLDAVKELFADNSALKEHITFVTTQDTHRYGRDMTHPEAILTARAYGEAAAAAAVTKEQIEMLPLDPTKEQFGLHGIVGTPGVAIAKPIQDRLLALEETGMHVHAISKINFSATDAGLLRRAGVDASSPEAADSSNIFADPPISTVALLGTLKPDIVMVSGICADICVVQSATGVKAALPETSVTVLDAATHYLFSSAKEANEKKLRESGVCVEETHDYPSNTDYLTAAAASGADSQSQSITLVRTKSESDVTPFYNESASKRSGESCAQTP